MTRYIKYFLLAGVIVTGCFEKDVFPDTPEIEFVDIKFLSENSDLNVADSLQLTFKFQDGGANLGFTDNDLTPPYFLYVDAENKVITQDNIGLAISPIFTAPIILENFQPVFLEGNLLTIRSRLNTYPVFISDTTFFSMSTEEIVFECPNIINQSLALFDTTDAVLYSQNTDFSFTEIAIQAIESEVPAVFNQFYYNLVLVYERKVGDAYERVDFAKIFGQTDCEIGLTLENLRIPLFDLDGEQGTFTCSLISRGFELAFLDDPIRIRFYVIDQLGNISNEEVTPDFFLADITQ